MTFNDHRENDYVVLRRAKRRIPVIGADPGWRWTRYGSNGKKLSNGGEEHTSRSYTLQMASTLNPGVEIRDEDGVVLVPKDETPVAEPITQMEPRKKAAKAAAKPPRRARKRKA